MIKVTLLGDSIRQIGYGLKVPELLGEEFDVFQPDVNCKFAKFTLRGLFDWDAQMAGSRIVHWNNGLWDICNLFGDGLFSTEEEYLQNILRIADLLLKKYNKVIFATTTPVASQNSYNSNQDIERYNALVVPRLKEKGVIINDLHKLVSADIGRYICDDHIHLTEAGIKACSEQVASCIRSAAETLAQEPSDASPAAADHRTGAPV